jgi:hypothetical protein
VTSAELSVLSGAGATSVEGSGGVPVEVHAPQGNISLTVPLGVPRTAVPASRTAEIVATHAALLAFRRPGDGYIAFGPGITMQITPLNASGGETDVGTVNATCTLNADQNTVLGVIRYHPVNSLGRPAPDPTVSGGSPGPATVRRGSPSPSASNAVVVLMVPPAPPSVVRRDGGTGSSLFEIPIVTLLILPGMVTAIVCAIAFVAFKAGRLTR